MKKKIIASLSCILLLPFQSTCRPHLHKRSSRTSQTGIGAGASATPSRSQSAALDDIQCSCSRYSQAAAAALADIQAAKREIDAFEKRCSELHDQTSIAQCAAYQAASQAATSQNNTQNMTAVVMVVGAYCMYTQIRKKKENDPLIRYYRRLYQQCIKQVRTIKQSRKQLKSFCINCLPHKVSSYFG